MREGLATFLMMLFILPAFIPWMPHGISHAMHDYHASHHQEVSELPASHNGHTHQSHAHDEELHHTAHFDIVSYYSDFLHVDLRHADEAVLGAPDRDIEDLSFQLTAEAVTPTTASISLAIRGPPDKFERGASSESQRQTYLLTQRLRI